MGQHLEQGEGGARSTKRSGSHLDDKGEGRISGQRKGTSKRGGMIDANVKVSRRGNGDHLTPQRSSVRATKTPERGGHSKTGHDFTNPSAGKRKSGSKMKQHPNNKRG